jgi:hypothetical protein
MNGKCFHYPHARLVQEGKNDSVPQIGGWDGLENPGHIVWIKWSRQSLDLSDRFELFHRVALYQPLLHQPSVEGLECSRTSSASGRFVPLMTI